MYIHVHVCIKCCVCRMCGMWCGCVHVCVWMCGVYVCLSMCLRMVCMCTCIYVCMYTWHVGAMTQMWECQRAMSWNQSSPIMWEAGIELWFFGLAASNLIQWALWPVPVCLFQIQLFKNTSHVSHLYLEKNIKILWSIYKKNNDSRL